MNPVQRFFRRYIFSTIGILTLFFAVNSYTTGLSPAVMEYMLKTTLVPRFGGKTSCDEIGLPVSATGGVVPCGATAIWEE
mgnify:CR=1 FL=1